MTTITFVSGTRDLQRMSPLLQATSRDGSVYLVTPASSDQTVDPSQLLVRIHPDGRVSATHFDFVSGLVTDQGLTQLQSDGHGHLNIVHYDLPA